MTTLNKTTYAIAGTGVSLLTVGAILLLVTHPYVFLATLFVGAGIWGLVKK